MSGIRSGDWTDMETNMETSSRSRERGRPAVKDLLHMQLKKDNVKVNSELLPVSVISYNDKNNNNININKYSFFSSLKKNY